MFWPLAVLNILSFGSEDVLASAQVCNILKFGHFGDSTTLELGSCYTLICLSVALGGWVAREDVLSVGVRSLRFGKIRFD